MPYLNSESLTRMQSGHPARNPGELNWAITQLLISYLRTNGLSYASASDAHSSATLAAAEFYRRVIAPYEDRKIELNGDVYPIQFTGGK